MTTLNKLKKALLLSLGALALLTGCKTDSKDTSTKEVAIENMETIYLAGGCFWGVEEYFKQFDGVFDTQVGYANGPYEMTNYADVCAGSGHAETVKVSFDNSVISLNDILEYYFLVIDPVSVNKQGNDRGIQYRTGIYYTDENQLDTIKAIYQRKQEEIGQPLAVEVTTLDNFFAAEEYHQDYLDKNPNGYCHIPNNMMHLNDNTFRIFPYKN